VVGIGAIVGRFDGDGGWWELIRKKEKQASGELLEYRLRAVLSYVNPVFWSATKPDGSPKWKVELVLRVGENKFRVDVAEGERMELNGRTLRCEGVTLCQIEK
jgi:hypothetical protein